MCASRLKGHDEEGLGRNPLNSGVLLANEKLLASDIVTEVASSQYQSINVQISVDRVVGSLDREECKAVC